MDYFKSFSSKILDPRGFNFEELALELFRYQANHNIVYRNFLQARHIPINEIETIQQIPFLPIQFFKTERVVTGNAVDFTAFYSSSGTTGAVNSKHYFWSEAFYLKHAKQIFEREYGPLHNYHILALLPSYLEREGSSLVAMVNYFIEETASEHSGFYLYNHQDLIEKLVQLQGSQKQVLLIGITFALLDLAEKKLPPLANLMVMETGGMKGRRKELVREEVHDILCDKFGLGEIHSEYGMTELMSQAYSKGSGKFRLPASLKVFLRDPRDPFSFSKGQGGINVIDLANFHSCAFVETQDLGRFDEMGNLEILGRFDNSEVRGCNLMVN